MIRQRGIFISFIAVALIGAGCSSFRLDAPLVSADGDWLQEAGSPQRHHYGTEPVHPPFSPSWQYNAGGGFSQNAVLAMNGVLFVSTLYGEVHLIDARLGKRVGRIRFGAPIAGSPVIYGNTLIVPLSENGQTLIAYDLLEGKEMWGKDAGPIESSPLLYRDTLIAVSRNGTVYSLDPETGREFWKHDLRERVYASPSASGSEIYVATTAGEVTALDIRTGEVVWERKGLGRLLTTPVTDGDRLYTASRDSMVYCIDLRSGKVRWTVNAGGMLYAAPAAGDGKLAVGTAGREIMLIDAGDGSVVWRQGTAGIVNTTPHIAGNFVYSISHDGTVFVLEKSDGTPIWSEKIPSRLKTSPLVWNSRLIICAEDRTVYSYRSSASQLAMPQQYSTTETYSTETYTNDDPAVAGELSHTYYMEFCTYGSDQIDTLCPDFQRSLGIRAEQDR